jgi:hypothetical protein
MIKFHRREREAGLPFGDDVATIPGQFQFRTIELKNVLLLFFKIALYNISSSPKQLKW